jgi:hypothetical protein
MITNWTLKAAFLTSTQHSAFILLIIPPTAALAAAVLAQKIFIFFDGFIIKPYFHNKSIENSSRSLF